ncbi:hypothetical protein ACQPZ2_30160 [Nocardia pseudovaccinii]|uniref:hypothetical protein n=1 Tax=Nocardia pseudovaccinii TaxID=189540 RepID=UPI003D8E2262
MPHHRYVCIQHRYWIGPPDTGSPTLSVEQFPEIVSAQRRHLRLMRRYGWAVTYDAVLTAMMIGAHRWDSIEPTPGLELQQQIWNLRSHAFIPPDNAVEAFSASKLFAAIYPEALALAPVIASPSWRRLAAGQERDLQRFVDEVRRRLNDVEYEPRGEQDPIAHWIESDCWRTPATPLSDFASAPGNRKPSQLRRGNQLSSERHWRSALFFAQRRQCGNVILHHRTIHPVIVREWSPAMQEFRGAIWMSQRTEKRFKAPQVANYN